jgi:hypothetical protein
MPDRLSLDEDPRMAPVLRKMFDHILKKVLKSRFQGINVQIVGETSLIEGATSAVTVQVETLLQFMFKFDIETVPKEIEGYKIMEQALPHNTLKPLYCDASAGLLCIPYLVNARNLHDVIKDGLLAEADVLKVYGDFLRRMLALWNQTYQYRRPDYEDQFVQRLRRRTKEAERLFDVSIAGQKLGFSELLRVPLQINGVDYPPLTDLLGQAVQLIVENPAPCSVTAHRDEHAKNILIETASNGDVPRWYLIDLPNVSARADWVWSIAKMRHWWLAYYYIDQAKRIQPPPARPEEMEVRFQVTPCHVLIEYDLDDRIPLICRKLDQKVEGFARQMGKLLKDPRWSRRYRASLFLVFYGGIPYHRKSQHVLPILLGEAVKALIQE